jgi:hypothetical protein
MTVLDQVVLAMAAVVSISFYAAILFWLVREWRQPPPYSPGPDQDARNAASGTDAFSHAN